MTQHPQMQAAGFDFAALKRALEQSDAEGSRGGGGDDGKRGHAVASGASTWRTTSSANSVRMLITSTPSAGNGVPAAENSHFTARG